MAQIFISYRRTPNVQLALNISNSLRNLGYEVFLDKEELHGGEFYEQLMNEIREATDVVVLLSGGTFERMNDSLSRGERDYCFEEIREALDNNKRIIPVMTDYFTWKKDIIPETIRRISDMNGIEYNDNYHQGFLDKLCSFLISKSSKISTIHGLLKESAYAERPTNNYLPNKEAYEELLEKFKENLSPLFIWGIGGIGKSQLARYFAQQYKEENDKAHIYWTTFHDCIRQTILDLPFAEQLYFKNEEEEYEARINTLFAQGSSTILIIDNTDNISEVDLYNQIDECGFRKMAMRFIFTTRSTIRDFGGIEVKPLPVEELQKLMRSQLNNRPDIKNDQLAELIQMCGSHTLTVDLIAKTLAITVPELNAKDIIDSFATANDDKFLEVYLLDGRDNKYQRIFSHLQSVFSISSLDEEQIDLLNTLSFVPVGGIDTSMFLSLYGNNYRNCLIDLIRRGWVRNENRNIKVHPIIAEVIWYGKKIKWERIRQTFLSIDDYINDRDYFDYHRYLSIKQYIENVISYNINIARLIPGDDESHVYYCLGYTMLNLGRGLDAEKSFTKSLNCSVVPETVKIRSHSSLGIALGKQGFPDKALVCHEESMLLPGVSDHPFLEAVCCRNLGISLGKSAATRAENERELINRSIELFEKGLLLTENGQDKKEKLEHCTLLVCLGVSKRNIGVIEDAIDMHRRALIIRQDLLGDDHWDTAGVYVELGRDYLCKTNPSTDDLEKAYDYLQKSFLIREGIFKDGHPFLMRVLKEMERCCTLIGDEIRLSNIRLSISELQQKMNV